MSNFKKGIYKMHMKAGRSGLADYLKSEGLEPYKSVDAAKYDANVKKYESSGVGKRYLPLKQEWGRTVEKEVIKAKTGIDPSSMSEAEYEKQIGPIRKDAEKTLKSIPPKRDKFRLS